jgi:hypothetical protein
MIYLKPLVPAVVTSLVAVVDAQPYLMLGALVLAIVGGWRALRVRDFNSEIQGLKAALNTAEIVKKTDDERRGQLEEQLRGAQERANVAERLVDSLRDELRTSSSCSPATSTAGTRRWSAPPTSATRRRST